MFRLRSILTVQVTMLLVLILVVEAMPASARGSDWLPAPTGPYQVGTTFYHWTDGTRDEVFTAEPNDKRELVVRLWYPAEVEASVTPVTYFPRAPLEATYFAQALGLTQLEFPIMEFAQTPTHSYRDVPLSAAKSSYPVLIYSHGWHGSSALATSQMEELASHGYIVVGIDHPHISGWTVFPNRQVVTQKEGLSMNQAFEVAAQDQVFVLNRLEQLNNAPSVLVLQRLEMLDEMAPGDQFSGHLDLERVGLIGSSWGSGVSMMACLCDRHFTAMVVEGAGTIPEEVIEVEIDRPVMFVDSAGESSTTFFETTTGPAYLVSVNTYTSWALGDFMLWLGNTEAVHTVSVSNAYARAFFDRYIKGMNVTLLDGSSLDYPEVGIEFRNL